MLAAADVRSELDIDASVLALALFVAPVAIAALVESAVLLATERCDRRTVVAAALVAMAIAQVGVAFSPGALLLGAAVTVWGIAGGVATGGAEAALIASSDDHDRTMARWTLFGSVGDLLAPALFAGIAWIGLGWRVSLVLSSAAALLDAALVLAGPSLSADSEDEGATPWDAVRAALRNTTLLRWLLAAAVCALFDEIVLAFGALHLREAGFSAATQGIVLGALPVGTTVGLAIVERAGWPPRRVLLASAAGTAVAWLAWLTLPGVAGTAILGFFLGICVSPMWALCTARAYATGVRPGVVAVLDRLFLVIELAAPLVLGLVADRLGTTAALVLLLVQPLVVAAVAASKSPADAAP